MKVTRTEKRRAEQLSAAVDELIRNPDARPDVLDPGDVDLLSTARQLVQMPSWLSPVSPALEQQVMRQIESREEPGRRLPRLKMGWAFAGLVAILLLATLFTPQGQTALASFMAVFNLGRTEVRITPASSTTAPLATTAAQDAAPQHSLTLEEAQAQVDFIIPNLGYVPAGYSLRGLDSYMDPDLPAWLPQPLFVELVYEDSGGQRLSLRAYPITLGDQATISGLNLRAAPIQDVQDVEVNGQPGVLLQLDTTESEAGWQEVVWEQGDLILALSATDLTEVELLRIADSVR